MLVNGRQLKALTLARVKDSRVLLASRRWAGAYHLVGYAVECGLKACILTRIHKTGLIFKDKKYLNDLSKSWTHNLTELVGLAGLETDLRAREKSNPMFAVYWSLTKDWTEVSRYERKEKREAEELFQAITNEPDGILRWIQGHW